MDESDPPRSWQEAEELEYEAAATKATDLGLKGILQLGSLENVEFPQAVLIRRKPSSEVLLTIPLPTSGPDMVCLVARKLGNGIYTRTFLNADGTGVPTKDLVVENTNGSCPWKGHCSE